MNTPDDPDKDLFREAMREVKPLPPGNEAPQAPKPVAQARFTRLDEREVLRESLLPPADDLLLSTGDELLFRRPHVPEDVLIRLRRGHYAVDAEIDLHGLSGAQAKEVLREFVTDAVQRELKCIRIVHGKGRRSGPRGPVLKNIVNRWLQHIDPVLAFASARAVDGGSGAVYVLLKSRR
ncbi:MAG TPA: Smr/MutS family protein [Povalibacter sp.]|uniref:Smr/MutS family protein n=1 Tax=Povalibacter sp. TaxID=1962978 RepID=UPI002C798D26|nr:Smr/MutS family protein [Povalibacter sp.]HMN44851.1 Smr/MutS family protein [Povalibacter sp.]